MKKIISFLLAALLILGVSLTVAATEMKTCAITVDSGAGAPGETVTVAVRIGDNPGFTNFAIALDYDREHLILKNIETANAGVPYLCASEIRSNPNWTDDGKEQVSFLVSASASPVKENGILFTAEFEIASDFTGETPITPQVKYIRNNEAVFSVFEEIRADIVAGSITSFLNGDVNGDGIVEYNDVMLAYMAFLGQEVLSAEQLAAVDRNGNGNVEESEYRAIYEIYIGG